MSEFLRKFSAKKIENITAWTKTTHRNTTPPWLGKKRRECVQPVLQFKALRIFPRRDILRTLFLITHNHNQRYEVEGKTIAAVLRDRSSGIFFDCRGERAEMNWCRLELRDKIIGDAVADEIAYERRPIYTKAHERGRERKEKEIGGERERER